MEIFARTSAQRALAASAQQLAIARERNAAVDRRVDAARRRANVEAPPLAMLVAAVMLSVVFGFGSALAVEVKRPRVADAREAERVARARVLAVVQDAVVSPERARRRADEQTPEYIDTSADSYRMLYLSLSATGSGTPFITVTGDEPVIVATVAANLAAIAAQDSRSTLVVDADMGQAAASTLFGVGRRAGLVDVVRDGLRITESIVTVVVGRDTTVDVVPAGPSLAPALDARTLDALRLEIARLSRRYDFTVLTESVDRAERGGQSLLVSPDVIVCARAGHTLLSGVAREIVRLRNAGALVRGIVVWNADVPTLADHHAVGSAPRARTGVGTAG
jgi:Mrp family chromosome partitioning ATPase